MGVVGHASDTASDNLGDVGAGDKNDRDQHADAAQYADVAEILLDHAAKLNQRKFRRRTLLATGTIMRPSALRAGFFRTLLRPAVESTR